MKKVYTSELNGFSESATSIELYAFESEEEQAEFYDMMYPSDEDLRDGTAQYPDVALCEYFGLVEEYNVPAGASYERYSFHMMGDYFAIETTHALNV